MSKYIPEIDKDNVDTILLKSAMQSKDCIAYAATHNFNVRFSDTTSPSSVEVIMDFINE